MGKKYGFEEGQCVGTCIIRPREDAQFLSLLLEPVFKNKVRSF